MINPPNAIIVINRVLYTILQGCSLRYGATVY